MSRAHGNENGSDRVKTVTDALAGPQEETNLDEGENSREYSMYFIIGRQHEQKYRNYIL